MKDSKQAEQVGEFVAIDSLIPHPKNPRNNDDAVKEIKQSIKRFGFVSQTDRYHKRNKNLSQIANSCHLQ